MSYVSVRLHAAHFDKTGSPKALRWGQAPASRTERFKVLQEEAAGGLEDCDEDCPVHAVLQDSRSIVLRMCEEADIKVPILMAEVAYASTAQTSVVAMTRLVSSKGARPQDLAIDVWLFVVGDGQAGLLSFLRLLSEGGAIRNDFEHQFDVPKKPFGYGAEGCVYKVHPLKGDKDDQLAAKVSRAGSDKQASKAEEEARIFFRAQGHPNIARLCGIFFTADWSGDEEKDGEDEKEEEDEEELEGPRRRQILLMEFYGKGSIGERIEQHGTYSENEALVIMNGLLSAVKHIHERGIVHRDVKPDNVLRGRDGRPILTDFGIAAFLDDKLAMEQRCGTPGFCAPEILTAGVSYGKKVDVFSAGVVLYVMLFGCTPFNLKQDNTDTIYQRIVDCRIEFPLSRAISEQVRRLAVILLAKDPEDRPSAAGALEIMPLVKPKAPAQPPTFLPTCDTFSDMSLSEAFGSSRVASPSGVSSTPRSFTPVAPSETPSKLSRSFVPARRYSVAEEEQPQKPTTRLGVNLNINLAWKRGLSEGSTLAPSEASTRTGNSGRPSAPAAVRAPSSSGKPSERSGRPSPASFIAPPRWFHRGRRLHIGECDQTSPSSPRTSSTSPVPSAPAAPVMDRFRPAFLRRRAVGAGGN